MEREDVLILMLKAGLKLNIAYSDDMDGISIECVRDGVLLYTQTYTRNAGMTKSMEFFIESFSKAVFSKEIKY